MTEEMKLVPKRRFKEFQEADAWKQQKLEEFGSIAMNKRIFKEQTSEIGDVPFYKIGTFGGTPDAYISRDLFEAYRLKYPYPQVGDVLISASGSIGRTVVYMGKEEYFQDSNIVWLKHDGRIDNSFLNFFYSIVKWEGLEGSTIKRLYNKNILETKISLPSIGEQKLIGKFFNQLDDLINLHQRKLEKTKALKSAYLSELFPTESEIEPKRRFEGFNQAWKQLRFADVLDFSVSNNSISRAGLNYNKGDVKNIHYGDILVKFDAIVDIKNVDVPWVTDGKPEDYKNQWLQNGDVIIADTAEDETAGKAIEVTGITNNYAISGLHTMVARPNREFAPKYLGYYLNSPGYHNTLLPLMQGTKVLSLNKANIAQTKIAFPTDLKEQAKIGSFFENIDNLINFQQRKLEKLQNLKKAYLNEMFI